MGRKKRKAADVEETVAEEISSEAAPPAAVKSAEKSTEKEPLASKYGLTAHSGEIVSEEIYVSDGSEDEDVPIVLAGSKMGLMRRGVAQPILIQPNRQWTRTDQVKDEEKERQREEELAQLDPAERAARLAREEHEKEEQEKQAARQKESEENAGRDPTLFSKRTAFDIRFDQIEDKPWTRGGDMSDFFNYGFMEDDWQVYADQQLLIRTELQDAAKQKRAPDPTIVPVTPRATTLTRMVATKEPVVVPAATTPLEPAGPAKAPKPAAEPKQPTIKEEEPEGGAWGITPAVARLMMEESEARPVEHANPDRHGRHYPDDSYGGGGGGGRGGGGGGWDSRGRGGDSRKRYRDDPRRRR